MRNDICIFHVTEIHMLNVLKLRLVCQEDKYLTVSDPCPLGHLFFRAK